MAEPIHCFPDVSAAPHTTPQEEWQDILALLQARGIFTLIKTSIEALPDITALFVASMDNPFGKNMLANLTVLLTMLGKIDSQQLATFIQALGQSLARLEEPLPKEPSLKIIFRLLRDQSLWQSISRLTEALKTFESSLKQQKEK